MIPPTILRLRSEAELQQEAAWLAKQPRWVWRVYVGFYATMGIATIAVVSWATWATWAQYLG